jgi:hypothetical protein
MKPDEMREQAQRWRTRAPRYDEPTAQALVEAAESFEALAQAKDAVAPEAPGKFLHRAYRP